MQEALRTKGRVLSRTSHAVHLPLNTSMTSGVHSPGFMEKRPASDDTGVPLPSKCGKWEPETLIESR
jgi:hypothetical protein